MSCKIRRKKSVNEALKFKFQPGTQYIYEDIIKKLYGDKVWKICYKFMSFFYDNEKGFADKTMETNVNINGIEIPYKTSLNYSRIAEYISDLILH